MQSNLFKFAAIFHRQPHRTLYSHEELGLLYIQARRQETFHNQANGSVDECKQYKDTVVQQFDEFPMHKKVLELLRFVYLLDLSANDIQNIKSLLYKYELAYFNNWWHAKAPRKLGTDIIRTCYVLNEPDIALEVRIDVNFEECIFI